MYRVLIADDEPSVVASLQDSLKWAELGLEVAAVVGNGNQAVEVMKKESIDIAILDIRMPGLSGLEVCERLHKIRKNLQIIIISGYAEFSYAERAIRYGVLGYCLKPLEYDQITRLLLKAEKNLEKNMQKPYEIEFLEAIERNDADAILEGMKVAGFYCEEFYVAVSVGDGKLFLENEKAIVIELGREQYGYLKRLPFSLAQLEKSISETGILGIGCGVNPVRPEQLSEIINIRLTQAFQYFVNPRQRICSEVDSQSSGLFLNRLQELISRNNWKAVTDELQMYEVKYWKHFNIRSALKVCNMVHSGKLFLGEENDFYIYSLRQLTSEYQDIRDMFSNLRQDIEEAAEQLKKPQEYTNVAFMELMSYIEENYSKEISLSSAAQNCHMSANYVSQLFKKETGTTFIHYITQLRMEEAIKLLQTTKKSTAEISALVGYNDYFYFLKSFKKYTGKTLGQYRTEN